MAGGSEGANVSVDQYEMTLLLTVGGETQGLSTPQIVAIATICSGRDDRVAVEGRLDGRGGRSFFGGRDKLVAARKLLILCA